MPALIFLGEMLVLLYLSRALNKTLFFLFYRFTHSEQMSLGMTTVLLFPGTIVHELSHLFVAEILGVRTGKLSLIPEYVEEHRVQAGSVQVAHSDPFRRTIIGMAPLFVGIITVTLLSSYLAQLFPQALLAAESADRLKNPIIYMFAISGYLLYAISNNMFPSQEDMKGVPAVLILLAMVIAGAYFVGVRFTLSGNALQIVGSIFSSLTTNLVIVIILNLILLLVFRMMLWMSRKSRR